MNYCILWMGPPPPARREDTHTRPIVFVLLQYCFNYLIVRYWNDAVAVRNQYCNNIVSVGTVTSHWNYIVADVLLYCNSIISILDCVTIETRLFQWGVLSWRGGRFVVPRHPLVSAGPFSAPLQYDIFREPPQEQILKLPQFGFSASREFILRFFSQVILAALHCTTLCRRCRSCIESLVLDVLLLLLVSLLCAVKTFPSVPSSNSIGIPARFLKSRRRLGAYLGFGVW